MDRINCDICNKECRKDLLFHISADECMCQNCLEKMNQINPAKNDFKTIKQKIQEMVKKLDKQNFLG